MSNYASLRGKYGEKLVELGHNNKNVVVLDADLAKSTKTLNFGKEFPDRFFDFGLAEQDMISTAAGIALTGKTVFASSFCVFLVGRTFDQIRQSIAYNNANVKLVGTHSGLGVGMDGATHQALEDIALIRPLPNFRIISPADAIETAQVIDFISNNYGPFFVRLTRNNLKTVHEENYKFKLGKADILREGTDLTIFATGVMVEKALDTAIKLKAQSIDAAVINFSSIKPFDKQTVLDYAKKTKAILTVEDHSVYGGIGSTIAEYLAQNYPVKMKIMGMDNQFARSGNPEALYKLFNLDTESIYKNALELLK
jgi:transketolase